MQWLTTEVEALEVDYSYLLTVVGNPVPNGSKLQGSVVKLIQALVCNCIRLYRVSQTHTAKLPATAAEPGDAACLLAVRGLKLLHDTTMQPYYKMQAMILLSYLILQSKYNFDARTQLVLLLRDMGLASAAWLAYKELDVKRVLHEKLAPLVFLRIAGNQPFGTKDFDPYSAMVPALEFFEQAGKEVPEYQELALQHENYSGFIDMAKFVSRLRASPTRIAMVYERRRIARLTNKALTHLEMLDPMSDGICASLLESGSGFPEYDGVGPVIAPWYLQYICVLDAAIELATIAESDQLDLLTQKAASMRLLRKICKTMLGKEDSGFTTCEARALMVCLDMVILVELMTKNCSEEDILTNLHGLQHLSLIHI